MQNSRPTFKRPWAFWLGVASVTGGALLHVSLFVSARHDNYMLRGMGFDRWMDIGMVLIVCGYVGVLYGLAPRFRRSKAAGSSEIGLKALDSSRLGAAHIRLMLVLMLGIAIDTQKPFTFTFILPGVANEYDLRSPTHPAPGHWPVALFPFVAIVGTVLGSLIWGHLGDRIGGMSAGGLLPIVYSLLAETIPTKRRGEVLVLVAGVGTAAGFLLASWTAHWLIPAFGWRFMWFFGIPTGLALIGLNKYIPESPRFLLANGRRDEAHEVMRSFGIVVSETPVADERSAAPEPRPGLISVFRRPHRGISVVLTVYGLAWGLVNFGFLVWLPIHVAKSGVSAGQVTAILARAALFATPGSILVSQIYARWSSRGALIAAAALEAATLGVFAASGGTIVHHTTLFSALIVVLLVSMWATISALAPYSAEIYPTGIRVAGSGVVAGATKLGGVLALGLSVAAIAPPSLVGAALLAAIPAGLGALMLLVYRIETRGRHLEEITAAPEQRLAEQPA